MVFCSFCGEYINLLTLSSYCDFCANLRRVCLIYEKSVISDVFKDNLLGVSILKDIIIDDPNDNNDDIAENSLNTEFTNNGEGNKNITMDIKNITPLNRKKHIKSKGYNTVLEELKNHNKNKKC
tara:strand:+ start:594 stop:965 length:372 start_codon:yes stop_codon:yes gene_type:complete